MRPEPKRTATLDAQAAGCGPPEGEAAGPRGSSNRRSPTSAARRVGWRRTARLYEPQEHSQQFRPIYNPNLSCSACRPSPPRRSAPGRQGRRPFRSQEQHLIHSPNPLSSSSGAPPPASAFGVRCAPRTAIPLKSRYPLSVQAIEACGAQKQRQLRASAVGGFDPRASASRKSTVQPTAPCPPHCGSAFAPPRFRRPLEFHGPFFVRAPARFI